MRSRRTLSETSAQMTMILVRSRITCLLYALVMLVVSGTADVLGDDYSRERARMIKVIETNLRRTPLERHDEAFDQRVLDVMAYTPRHLFVPEPGPRNIYRRGPFLC